MFEPRTLITGCCTSRQLNVQTRARLTTALKMQRIVVALALAASVQAFAPPRLVATTPAAKSVLPLSAPAKSLTALRSAVAEETFEQ